MGADDDTIPSLPPIDDMPPAPEPICLKNL